MTLNKVISEFKQDLIKREYAPNTITIYCKWIKRIAEFHNPKSINSLGQKEINEYLTHLNIRLNTAPSTINQAFQSYQYLFNRLWDKRIDFNKIDKPKRKRSNPDILTTKEIIKLIEVTNNIKQKLILAISYSAGLDKSEVRNLKLSDIDYNRKTFKVRDKKGRIKRTAILAKYVIGIIKQHIKENNPNKYLIESKKINTKYSESSITKLLESSVLKADISKKITFKTLKYSYVIHMNSLGKPLNYILEDLQLKSSQSVQFFTKISSRGIPNKQFCPLDKIALQTEVEYPINSDFLEQSILGITDKDEADYLKEALICMTSGSLRAGIIFSWNAAVLNLRKKCFNHGKTTLNKIIKKHYSKAKEINNLDDFAYIKDSLLIQITQDLHEIDKSEKNSLEDCLNVRNKCGHPSKYRIKPIKAAAFMEELISIVFKKNK